MGDAHIEELVLKVGCKVPICVIACTRLVCCLLARFHPHPTYSPGLVGGSEQRARLSAILTWVRNSMTFPLLYWHKMFPLLRFSLCMILYFFPKALTHLGLTDPGHGPLAPRGWRLQVWRVHSQEWDCVSHLCRFTCPRISTGALGLGGNCPFEEG